MYMDDIIIFAKNQKEVKTLKQMAQWTGALEYTDWISA